MPWRRFFTMFLHNEKVIQKLSESWPIRTAARQSVYWFLRGKDKAKEIQEGPAIKRLKQDFKDEYNRLSDKNNNTSKSKQSQRRAGERSQRHRPK